MDIDKIYHNKEISIRAKNVCIINKLYDLNSILNYYNTYKSFKSLNYCGSKTNDELISLCIKNQDSEINLNNKIESKPLDSIIFNLTDIQLEIVNNYIRSNVENLSNRTRNALLSILNENFDIYNIYNTILSNKKFKFINYSKIGAKSTLELNEFFELIKEFIKNVYTIQDRNQIISLQNKYTFSQNDSLSLIPESILETKSIFKIANYVIEQDLLFNSKQNLFFRTFYNIYQPNHNKEYKQKKGDFSEPNHEFNYQKQIINEKLKSKFLFIKKIEDNLFENYQIDIKNNFLYINDEIMNQVNKKSDTNFSKDFITYLLSIYSNSTYDLLGNFNDVLVLKGINSNLRHIWNNLYLIEKVISNEFDFFEFMNDIKLRLNKKIKDTYKLNLNTIITNYKKNESIRNLDKIIDISKFLIVNEFGLKIDDEYNITFLKNKEKPAREYIEEALTSLGKPSKVNEITKKILELHPYYNTNDNKVRASLRRQYGFVPIGKTSVFGLKIWEKSIENFKGGTIRDIVYEYLKEFKDPKKIDDILTYVLKYRPNSNKISIISNLKLDKSKRFLFFKNSLIGLSGFNKSLFHEYEEKMTV